MTTSGTTIWNPDLSEMVEEAYERAGLETRNGYQLRTAWRSLNYLLTSWANQGINLWTITEADIPLVVGQAEYPLPLDCVDITEQVIRQYPASPYNQTDIIIPRIALPTYAAIPNKLETGRPVQVYVDRLSPVPQIFIWPTPQYSGYTFHYWYLRRLQDAGTNATVTQDVPFRFYEALTAGLSWQVAKKQPEMDMQRVEMLKRDYEEALELAKDEDRDKSSVRFVPLSGYLSGGW